MHLLELFPTTVLEFFFLKGKAEMNFNSNLSLKKKVSIFFTLVMGLLLAGLLFYVVREQRHLSLLLSELHMNRSMIIRSNDQIIEPRQMLTWLNIQKKVKNTVVQVYAQTVEINWLEPYKSPEQGEGVGSGFFIDEHGSMITNYHVVAQASSVQIQIPHFGMERFDMEIVGVSPERDIALLKPTEEALAGIKGTLGSVPFLKLGDSDEVLRFGFRLSIRTDQT